LLKRFAHEEERILLVGARLDSLQHQGATLDPRRLTHMISVGIVNVNGRTLVGTCDPNQPRPSADTSVRSLQARRLKVTTTSGTQSDSKLAVSQWHFVLVAFFMLPNSRVGHRCDPYFLTLFFLRLSSLGLDGGAGACIRWAGCHRPLRASSFFLKLHHRVFGCVRRGA
jgi:hypothetical protein